MGDTPEQRWRKVHGPTRLQQVTEGWQRLAWAARSPAIALAMLLFAVSAAVTALSDFTGADAARTGAEAAQEAAERASAQVKALQARLDCRAKLRDDVDRLQNERQAALADGLAAFASDDDLGVQMQAARIRSLSGDITKALDRLAKQDDLCPGDSTVPAR